MLKTTTVQLYKGMSEEEIKHPNTYPNKETIEKEENADVRSYPSFSDECLIERQLNIPEEAGVLNFG